MKVDIGEVLSRSWQISWKNKSLWIIGAVMMLVSFLFLPIFLIPMAADIVNESLNEGLIALLFLGGILLCILIVYPAGALLNAALTQGILHAEQGEERKPFMELIQKSAPFFWRYLGVMTLFGGIVLLFMFVMFLLMFLISMATMGLGMMCMWPLTLLQYPLMLVWYVCMEQALAAVMVDNMSVLDATKQSWQLFRSHLFTMVIVGLVFYFGVSMLSSFVMMPFMLPFFFLPFAIESAEFGRILLIVGGLFTLVFFPLFCFVQGGAMTLMKSGWVITYLRIKHSSNTPLPVLQEAAA